MITIIFIDHDKQRYRTLGDWQYDPDTDDIEIKVSKTGDWRSNVLIAVHELVEVLLCQYRGITARQVDDFDMAHPDAEEPGDLPDAPYGDQHCFAMAVERMLAAAMKYPWVEHERRCEETDDEYPSGGERGRAVSG